MMSVEDIARACRARIEDAGRFCAPLNEAMDRFDISTARQRAAFLATVAIESAYLSTTRENLNYTKPERLALLFPRAFKSAAQAEPYVRNPAALSQKLYNGYSGRGLIQLTWEANYAAAGDALGHDYVRYPEMVEQPLHAALTAAWFWNDRGCNELAEQGDMAEITRRVNGPKRLHLDERTELARSTLSWLA